uniref:Si:ch1073-13h15.3 n=1 Tax=Hucho hucho TaxID=62062 RepID=A0A4W5KRC2_9TELE
VFIMLLLIFLAWLVVWAGGTYWYLFGKPSPFSLEGRWVIYDNHFLILNLVICPGFSVDKVPQNLDVIVIGSGIGGLMVAATLAKSGGCCHTYVEKGFEFDVDYVGEASIKEHPLCFARQITEGQLEFVELDQHFDTIQIGEGEDKREYTIFSGKTEMEAHLKNQFPDDVTAIETFFNIMKVFSFFQFGGVWLTLIPQWLALFLLKSGITNLCSSIFTLSGTGATDLVSTLTTNKDLHVIFSYLFYGTCFPPKDSSVMINALLLHHYKRGAYYPKEGASEISYHIIPVIQKSGGNVLVRAPVTQILVNNDGAAYGVKVRKGQEEVEVHAPVIISNCGLGSLLVFSGFDGTQEELGIVSTNFWLFKNNDMDEDAPDNIPMMFITFPSAKDPTAKTRHPGKSCMTILTMVKYEWFEEWTDTSLREKDVATPLTNMHYLGPQRGAMYSAEHNLDHFHAELACLQAIFALSYMVCVDVPFPGQDVFSCGIAGALHGGLLCASTVLDHIVYIDLLFLKKKLKKQKVRKMARLVKKLE